MFSPGEFLVLIVAAVAVIGPKDVPIFAKAAGRYVGRAVGYIQSARGQIDDVLKRSQVDQVHKELRETMAQLEAIRHEIRTGISITNPGPLTRSILNVDLKEASPAPDTTHPQAVVKQDTNLQSSDGNVSQRNTPLVSETQVVLEMQELQRAASHATVSPSATIEKAPEVSIKPPGFHPGPDGTFETMPPSTARATAHRLYVRPVGVKPVPSPEPFSELSESAQEITVLPISAVSAGLLSPKTGSLSGGADLVLESVMERKVAFETLKFLQENDPSVLR